MRWEERLLALFDDLEQQAEGLALAERDAEVAELSRAEYARVDLLARLHASAAGEVTLGLAGSAPLSGTLARVGRDWCLVRSGQQDWAVPVAAVTYAGGLSPRALGEPARPLTGRLGFASALRGIAEAHAPVVVRRTDGGSCVGLLGRVGADFVEVLTGDVAGAPDGRGAVVVVPFAATAAVGSV